MNKPRFLIAGAGLGGLAAAVSLLRKGFDVELYEQAPQLAEFGAGVQVSANSARVLYELGFRDDLERIGTRVSAREECAADFSGWHSDVQELIANVAVPYKWALMAREPLARWTLGRATLLGDACHPSLPYLAQGAAMAFEDAFVLARCVEALPNDIDQALKLYESARVQRTTRIVRATIENLASMHNASLAEPGSAEKHIANENREARTREKYDWLYGYDAVNGPFPAVHR